MRTLPAAAVTRAVRDLCIEANCTLPPDVAVRLEQARAAEPWPTAVGLLDDILENDRLAARSRLPICQDTGLACVFVELGQELHVEGNLRAAIDEGVRQGYGEGFLRKSVVADPLERGNTGDNTPAVVHFDLVPGDRLTLTIAPKGAGSENMSRIAMLKPSDGEDGVRAFVLETVQKAGSNPCPPIVVGVGLGGSFEQAALLAKRALLRPLDRPHSVARYARLEAELLEAVNALGIGPQGFGGRATALGVSVETSPTHIAMLPCAVNISCHVTRRQTAVL